MNRAKLPRGKFPLGSAIYVGLIILGIGCISWAIISMRAQSGYSADAPFSNSSPITSDLETNFHTDKTSPSWYNEEDVIVESEDKSLYPVYPKEGDNIGSLIIPALNRKIDILQGTEEKELKKGVGHFTQSVLPGEKDNCVISGHRDTVFRQLYKLEIGDHLIVQTKAGTFTYEVDETRIVHADDKTVIVPTDDAVLTMTTCYPFYAIGDAPDRYIVSSVLVKSELTNF